MSPSPPPRPRSSISKANIGAAPILGDPLLLQNPRLIQFANQLANWKCWKALQEGQIQVVHRRKSPMYIPRVDIIDDAGSPTIDAIFEVPGLRSDEIHVTLREGHVVVHGERRPSYRNPTSLPVEESSSHSNTRAPLVRELRYGPFQRRIKLPDNIRESDIVARLADGMLKVTWPRSSESNDSDTCIKPEASSPSLSTRAMSTSPEPFHGKTAADTAQQVI